MKTTYLKTFALASAALLTGCASITQGTHQNITVTTPPVHGARCQLKNTKGVWVIPKTPGWVKVHKASGPLNVTCRKLGYAPGKKIVNSHMQAAVAGNVIFGGLVGVGLDSADGAAFKYPKKVVVPMRQSSSK